MFTPRELKLLEGIAGMEYDEVRDNFGDDEFWPPEERGTVEEWGNLHDKLRLMLKGRSWEYFVQDFGLSES